MFYGEWSNSKEVFSAFKADADDRKDAKIIFAHYTQEVGLKAAHPLKSVELVAAFCTCIVR